MSKPVYLGTAQWGNPYGVTNVDGVPDDDEVRRMLMLGTPAGLDTARVYGPAEIRIAGLAPGFPVQTKINAAYLDMQALRNSLQSSLDRLGRTFVDTLLIHDWATLHADERATALSFLAYVKGAGLVGRTGVSIYEAHEIRDLPDVDVIQLPASVMSQAIIDSPEVEHARSCNVTIQARSIYLQGIALDLYGMQTCLAYVHHHPAIDEIVVGAETAAQLAEFWQAWNGDLPMHDWTAMACDDWRITDPRVWRP